MTTRGTVSTDRIHAAAPHGGTTLAPLLGVLIAGDVLAGSAEASLQPFRPARCATPALAAANLLGEVQA